MVDVVFAHIDAVDLDQTLVIGVQALQQPGDRGFAGPAAAHDPNRRALRDLERNLVERGRRRPFVSEGHVCKLEYCR